MTGVKHFVDSNIWLYAFVESQDTQKTESAKTIIQLNEIAVSTQVINEVCNNLIKKARFPEEKIQQLIKCMYNKYHVIEINEDILMLASEIRTKHFLSFWDSMIMASSILSGARTLYSEDMQHGFVIEQVQIINPFK